MTGDYSEGRATAEYLLYLNAGEESPLWDLTSGAENYFHDDYVTIHPALPRELVAATLLQALEYGDVVLYDADDPEKAEIPREEAIRVTNNPAYYTFETAPAMICVCVTDTGEARWRTMKSPEFERRPRD